MKKIKKIKMNTSLKWCLVSGLSMSVVLLGILMYQAFQKIDTLTEENVLYTYTIDTESLYEVDLLPNELYTQDMLGEDQIYLANFVEGIRTSFSMMLEASEQSTIRGNYEIVAEVASYTIEDDQKKDIWTKQYVLVAPQMFQTQESTYTVEQEVTVDYPTYNAFSESIAQATGVNATTEVRVFMSGAVQLETTYGVCDKGFEEVIYIPLGDNYFNITKGEDGYFEDAITESVTTTLPPNRTEEVGYGIALGIVCLAIVVLRFGTVEFTADEQQEKKVRAFFRAHGSRMVGVDYLDTTLYPTQYQLVQVEDLIKVADELEKPVLYCTHETLSQIADFYVCDETYLYTYHLDYVQENTGQQQEVTSEVSTDMVEDEQTLHERIE